LSQPKADGGLGLGTVVTSALFLTAILAVVVFLTITRRDETPARTVAPEELQPHLHLPHPHVPDVHFPHVAPPRPAGDELSLLPHRHAHGGRASREAPL